MENRYLSSEANYLKYAKEIFEKHFPFGERVNIITDFDSLYNKLSDNNKDMILRVSFFYYYRGWKLMQEKEWHKKVAEDFIFIVLISIAEAILSEGDYIDFKGWIIKNHLETRKIEDEIKIYEKSFGSIQKFKIFINSYLLEKDKVNFIKQIKEFRKQDKKFNQISIEKIVGMFYGIRSDFVHEAKYIPLSAQADGSCFKYNNKYYSVWTKFEEIILIFERGFLNYFYKTLV
jgi:hypothetical protein